MRVVLVVVAIVVASCGRGPTSPGTVAGTPFELKTGATAMLPDGTRLTFGGVLSDSRCPIDAICISAGDAAISVSFVSRDGTDAVRELHTQRSGSQISYGTYTIALTELQPYPRSTGPTNPADYVATFVVSVR
jgi:hypothetical protein